MSSDKTAIDRLRGILGERGVHYCGEGYMVRFNGNGYVCRAYSRANRAITQVDNSSLDVVLIGVSPEQAIAATLGSEVTDDDSVSILEDEIARRDAVIGDLEDEIARRDAVIEALKSKNERLKSMVQLFGTY